MAAMMRRWLVYRLGLGYLGMEPGTDSCAKHVARRVWTGISTDYDTAVEAAREKDLMTELEIRRVLKIAREAAFAEIRDMLSTTSDDNPIPALDRFQRNYPNHGDFDRARDAERQAQTVTGDDL